jgi:hypothetical protein
MLKTLRLQPPLTISHFFTETGAPTALRAWQLPFRRRYRPFQTSVSRHMFFQCNFEIEHPNMGNSDLNLTRASPCCGASFHMCTEGVCDTLATDVAILLVTDVAIVTWGRWGRCIRFLCSYPCTLLFHISHCP